MAKVTVFQIGPGLKTDSAALAAAGPGIRSHASFALRADLVVLNWNKPQSGAPSTVLPLPACSKRSFAATAVQVEATSRLTALVQPDKDARATARVFGGERAAG